MSFGLSVQRFVNGDAAAMDSRAFHTVWPPRHLPEEVREDVTLVGCGLDIDRVIQAG